MSKEQVMKQRVIEKIRIGEGYFLNAQDHGIEDVELPHEGNNGVSRIIMKDGWLVETNKPIEVWYREVETA